LPEKYVQLPMPCVCFVPVINHNIAYRVV